MRYSEVTHTQLHRSAYGTDGQNRWPGLFSERIIIPSVSPYCTCYPTEQTVAGLLVPLADRGPPVWACEICILAHGALSLPRQGGATDCGSVRVELVKMISTREEIDGKREPRVSRARGDRRRAVLDSFEQLQIDFQAKHICIRKTVLRAIRVSCGMCSLNRWIIFLELSCRNFSPLK